MKHCQARLDTFVDLLLRWNCRINLIGDVDQAEIRSRHMDDSLQLLPLLPRNTRPLADLGSGAGFPGLMLATADPRPIHLVEADKRKAAFLREAARVLKLENVAIHNDRIENVMLPAVGTVTARALAPLPVLLGYTQRILPQDGVALFPKGATAEAELTAAARTWTMRIERFPSRTHEKAIILRLSHIRRAA